MTTIYRTFNNDASTRLAYYKSVAAKHNENHGNGKPGVAITWKQARSWSARPPHLTRRGPKSPNYYYTPEDPRQPRAMLLDSLDQWPGTVEGDAHDILKLDHTGWYTDNFQYETVKGAVVSLPGPRGIDGTRRRRYYPAIYSDTFDVATVYIDDGEEGDDAEREAARSADHYAERYAEDSREYEAKEQAEQQIDEAREAIKAARAKIRALIREIKAAGREFSPAICEALKSQIERLLKERAEAFKTIERLEDNFWSAVNNY